MQCKKCNKDIDNDAIFCPMCGTEVLTQKQQMKRQQFYSSSYEDNKWSDMSRNLFFVGFFAFDLILSTIIGMFGIPNIWIYMISVIVYCIAIFYGFKGVRFALNLKKKGKRASGLFSSIAIDVTCFVILIVNVTTILNIL